MDCSSSKDSSLLLPLKLKRNAFHVFYQHLSLMYINYEEIYTVLQQRVCETKSKLNKIIFMIIMKIICSHSGQNVVRTYEAQPSESTTTSSSLHLGPHDIASRMCTSVITLYFICRQSLLLLRWKNKIFATFVKKIFLDCLLIMIQGVRSTKRRKNFAGR